MAVKHKKLDIEIPEAGSLGILALGAVGLKAWRKKRAENSQILHSKSKNAQ